LEYLDPMVPEDAREADGGVGLEDSRRGGGPLPVLKRVGESFGPESLGMVEKLADGVLLRPLRERASARPERGNSKLARVALDDVLDRPVPRATSFS